MKIFQPIVTASLHVQDTVTAIAFTGSLYGTASWAVSSSHANNAINAESSSNFTVTNTLYVDSTATNLRSVISTIVGSNNLYTTATGSYTAAFGKYTLHNGANARAGEFITVWNGTATTYTDVSVTDVGNTADIVFSSVVVGSDLEINATAASSGWTIRMITTFL